MNEEEKFDELINSKLSEREFPFDELNWDEAERLIIQQERWSKIKRTSFIFSAGLAIGIAAMLPFVLNNHSISTNQQASKTNISQPQVVQNNAAIPVSQGNNNGNVQNSPNNVKAPMPVQSAFVKKDNSTGTGAASANHITAKKRATPQPVLVATTDKRKIRKQHIHQIPKDNIVASAVITNKVSANGEAITPKDANPEKTQVTDVNPGPVINKDNTPAVNSLQSNPIAKTNGNLPSTPVATNPSPSNNIAANNNASHNKSAANITANPTVNKTSNKVAKAKASIKDKDAITKNSSPGGGNSSANPPIKRDSIMAVERLTLPGTEQPYMPDYDANILSVYAGGNYSFGWNNNGTREGSGITPLGGFIYTHYFNYRYSASIGIGYSELNKLDKTYTGSTIQYDFGENANVTTVTPQRIYYLTMPFKFQVNINDKNLFSFGLDFLFMLTTASTLTTYQQSPFGQEAGSSTMQNGYTQGFSNYDFQLTGAYTRMLTNRLGIRPEYYFGVNYLENKSFPGINQYERNMGVRLVLSYQLMK